MLLFLVRGGTDPAPNEHLYYEKGNTGKSVDRWNFRKAFVVGGGTKGFVWGGLLG